MGRPRLRMDWWELAAQFAAGDVPLRSFARQAGVHPETLRRWAREVAGGDAGPARSEPLTFVEVELPQVVVAHRGGLVEVLVGRDVMVRLDHLPSAAWLAELARAC